MWDDTSILVWPKVKISQAFIIQLLADGSMVKFGQAFVTQLLTDRSMVKLQPSICNTIVDRQAKTEKK